MTSRMLRTRHLPAIPMFDRNGLPHGVTLDVDEVCDAASPGLWTPVRTTMRCEGDLVVQDRHGAYRLIGRGLVLRSPDTEH